MAFGDSDQRAPRGIRRAGSAGIPGRPTRQGGDNHAGDREDGGAVAAVSLLLAGCGGDSAGTAPDGAAVDAGATTVDGGDSTGAPVDGGGDAVADALAVITVDGITYSFPDFMGGDCNTQGDPDRNEDLKVLGYAESSDGSTGRPNVSLRFDRTSAESSPSGEEEFWGHLGSIGGGAEGPWTATSLEPWPWLAGDRSHVTGTVTMEDSDGGTVEVAFDITCT